MSAEVESDATGSIFAPQYRALTFGVVAVMSIAAFEGMGVITAMPTAARDLDGLALYGWGLTAFSVASLFAMAVAGGWADSRGPMVPLTIGLLIFAAGLIDAGLAPEHADVVEWTSAPGVRLRRSHRCPLRRHRACLPPKPATAGVYRPLGCVAVPGIVGPLVAGVVTERFGWRWVFFGVLVLVIPVAIGLLTQAPVAEHRARHRGGAGRGT